MLKDQLSQMANPSLDFSFEKGKTIASITQFLEKKLPMFSADLRSSSTSEDQISQECCIYLAREARDQLFLFHFQHKYVGRRSSDISIISAEPYTSKDPLFVIEAKRLPTPGTSREREYVQGNLGGVERFKRNVHGPNLKRSAMFGYVQENTCQYWAEKIIMWIRELIKSNADSTIVWKEEDVLKFKKNFKNVDKYEGKHCRNTITHNDIITLDHYLISLKEME